MDDVSRKTSTEYSKRKKQKNFFPGNGSQWREKKAAFLEMYNLWLKQGTPVGYHKGSFKTRTKTCGSIHMGAFGSSILASDAGE